MKKSTLTAFAAIATALAVMMTVSPDVGAEQAARESSVQNAKTREETTVTLAYPDPEIDLTMGIRLEYKSGNPAIAKVNEIGVLIPVAPGKTMLTVVVSARSEGYTGMAKIPINVVDKGPVKLSLEPKTQARMVKAAGHSFVVRTVSIPKGMPVTTGIANRTVGTTQSLAAMAASYHTDIAINGSFFDSYSDIPDPYGNLITGGLAEHLRNNGTTIG